MGRGICFFNMMNKVGYILAATVFVGFVLLLSFPYLQARLRPLEPLAATTVGSGMPGEPEVAVAPNTLRIVSLGIEAPVVYVTEKSEPVYQEALRTGVVHFPDTAEPGRPGNSYIFGHSSDYVWSPGDYKTVFARLPEIEIGSEIEITDPTGQLFKYRVFETKVVGPRDLRVLDQFNYERSILTLQTSYPLGTALQRYIVVAELVGGLGEAEE
jgi:LPXTG-site transpeptidase (sortase) family protein